MKLYYNPASTYCMKTLLGFYEKGVEFEGNIVNLMDETERKEYIKKYPLGKVPCLFEDNGHMVPESSIIVEWLENNFAKLPGKKHLMLGNHDNPKFLAPFFKSISLWKDMSDVGLLLSHTPQHESTLAESHRFGTGPILNVHGHIHSNPSPEGPYKCVCVEQTDFKPVNLDELIAT